MSYILIVLCHNDIHYIKAFESLIEAEATAIVLANEWYQQEGLENFSDEEIKTIEAMNRYYQSESYFNSGDYVHIVIEEMIDENLKVKPSTKTINLKANGEIFDIDSYSSSDNLDAVIVSGEDIASVRVTVWNEVGINLISNPETVAKEFSEFLNYLKISENLREYLLDSYEEYLNV